MEKKIKIVLVDDNEDYLFTMTTFLTKNGFEALSATNEKDGIELIQKELPDIILLDVMMESLFSYRYHSVMIRCPNNEFHNGFI